MNRCICLVAIFVLLVAVGAAQEKPAQGQTGGQAGAAAPAAPAGPQATPEQIKAFQSIQAELDPARQMAAVDDFAKKYPDSPLLSDVYSFGGIGAQQASDVKKALDYGERSLKANPNNLRTLLMMASMLPIPQASQGASDAERDKHLADAETYANRALQQIETLPKPASQTDEQFAKVKQSLSGNAHSALGMVHLVRATEGLAGADAGELNKAENEYQTAVSSDQPEPQDYYRLGEAYAMDKKYDEAIDAFSKASKSGQGSAVQQYADQRIQAIKQEKSKAAPPAAPK